MKIVQITYADVTEVHDVEESTIKDENCLLASVCGKLAHEDKDYYWLIISEQSNRKHEILIIPRGCVIELRSLSK